MTSRILALCLLFSNLLCQVQTKYFTTTIDVTNPPYGIVAQIFNHGATPIYIDEVSVSAGLFTALMPSCTSTEPNPDHTIACGYILQSVYAIASEEINCTPKPILWEDFSRLGNSTATATDTAVTASSQPCNPHGLAYGIPYTGQGNCNGFNYSNCAGLLLLKSCREESCTLQYSVPRPIPPGAGISVWTARYRIDGYAFPQVGITSVNFKWHENP